MADPLLTPDPLTTRYARALLDLPEGSTPLEVLSVVTDLKARLALFEAQVVLAAKAGNNTWDEIGRVVGMTRQNTYRKFGALTPSPTRDGRPRRVDVTVGVAGKRGRGGRGRDA